MDWEKYRVYKKGKRTLCDGWQRDLQPTLDNRKKLLIAAAKLDKSKTEWKYDLERNEKQTVGDSLHRFGKK
jgi:hypothetical protein